MTERVYRRVAVVAADHGGFCSLLHVALSRAAAVSIWGAVVRGRCRTPPAAATDEPLFLLRASVAALRPQLRTTVVSAVLVVRLSRAGNVSVSGTVLGGRCRAPRAAATYELLY